MVDPRARNQARLGDQVLASERPAKLARRAGPRIDSEDYYYNQHYDPRLHAGEEMVTQHGPRLQNHNLLNILFYIRLTDRADDVVVKVLKESVRYLLKEQERVGREIIGSIYLEEWVHKLVKKDLHSILSGYPRLNNGKFIQIWPFITNVYELAPDMNSLLQPNIDIAYTLGGDGTLLSLVRDLYLNYKPNHLPYIAAFNSGSLGYLCNFKLEEIKSVYDSTIFQSVSRGSNKKQLGLGRQVGDQNDVQVVDRGDDLF